jgi:hypothetical protein
MKTGPDAVGTPKTNLGAENMKMGWDVLGIAEN